MSIARAMTKRIKRTEVPPTPPTRSQSTRNPGQPINRNQISSPVALLSTTNMLSYNAPDIATIQNQKRHASSLPKKSMESHHSAEDSDHSASTVRSRSSSNGSRETLTDASSVGSSPTSPAPNHLSCYFPPAKAPRRSASTSEFIKSPKPETIEEAPAVPERALSHSKRAHERMAQKRSLQSMKSTGSLQKRDSNRSSREHRTSADMFRSTIDAESHPFVKELEQLNEVAEEFSNVVQSTEMDEDNAAMSKLNLGKFCAADYLNEIQPMYNNMFESRYLAAPVAWI